MALCMFDTQTMGGKKRKRYRAQSNTTAMMKKDDGERVHGKKVNKASVMINGIPIGILIRIRLISSDDD